MSDDLMSPREIAEQFVREKMSAERDELQSRLDEALRLEREVGKEFDKADAAWWKLASVDLDAEPTKKEEARRKTRDGLAQRLSSVGRAASSNREKLSRLDLSFERRVSEKLSEVERRKNGNQKGESMSAQATKRVPVPQSVIDRIVRDTKTKSQQEVADALNKEGLKTASGKPWTPQNIWHAVKKATGKGVPRKASKTNGGRKTGAARKSPAKPKTAKPKTATAKRQVKSLSKSAQASGTSRGGTGSKKKTGGGRKINNRKR